MIIMAFVMALLAQKGAIKVYSSVFVNDTSLRRYHTRQCFFFFSTASVSSSPRLHAAARQSFQRFESLTPK